MCIQVVTLAATGIPRPPSWFYYPVTAMLVSLIKNNLDVVILSAAPLGGYVINIETTAPLGSLVIHGITTTILRIPVIKTALVAAALVMPIINDIPGSTVVTAGIFIVVIQGFLAASDMQICFFLPRVQSIPTTPLFLIIILDTTTIC